MRLETEMIKINHERMQKYQGKENTQGHNGMEQLVNDNNKGEK